MAFSWETTCTYVISMPHSAVQRASMRRQLAAQGLSNTLHFWQGLRLNASNEQAVLDKASAACVVPAEYAAPLEDEPTGRLRGIVGSTLAHLLLLRHAYLHDSCRHVLVLADDVVLKPDFRSWVAERVMAALPPTADFVNLAAVRAFGLPIAGSAASRVTARQRWPQWDGGTPRPGGELRSPNLLVSSYIARRAALPVLLASFRGVEDWRPQCSIDQVLDHATQGKRHLSPVCDLLLRHPRCFSVRAGSRADPVRSARLLHHVRHRRTAVARRALRRAASGSGDGRSALAVAARGVHCCTPRALRARLALVAPDRSRCHSAAAAPLSFAAATADEAAEAWPSRGRRAAARPGRSGSEKGIGVGIRAAWPAVQPQLPCAG